MPLNLIIPGPKWRVDDENYPSLIQLVYVGGFVLGARDWTRAYICRSTYCTTKLSYSSPNLFSIVIKYTERKMSHSKHFQLYTSVALSAFTLIGNQFPELF